MKPGRRVPIPAQPVTVRDAHRPQEAPVSSTRDEIVDSTGAVRRRVRHALLRVGGPLAGVGSVIVAIGAITLHSYQANRAGALALSHEVLATLQSYVAARVDAYLDPATGAAGLSRDILEHTDEAGRAAAFTSFAASVLRRTQQAEAFYLADGRGDFAVLRRSGNGGTVTSTVVAGPDGKRRVSTVETDARGHEISHTDDPDAHYDPRTRPWFRAAVTAHGAMAWSQPSLFRPTGKPVVTASFATFDPDGLAHVTAVDIALDALSHFLSQLEVGRNGRAAIVDRAGAVIAAPALVDGAASHGDPAAVRLDPVRNPALVRAFDHFRVDGFGHAQAVVGHDTWVTIAAPLPGASPDWVLLIVAPERDFAGFAVANGRQSLLFSLVIVALALLLAGFLIRQGRRSDRLALLLAEQAETAREERHAIAALAAEPTLFDTAREAPVLTEALADFAEAGRTSLWRLARDGRTLFCEDQYETAAAGHTGGFELSRTELPRFFDLICAGKAVSVADAGHDPRTSEFHRLVMAPSGFSSLALVPVSTTPDEIGGAVLVEDAQRFGRASHFAATVASLAAIRFRLRAEAPAEDAEKAEAAEAVPDVAEARTADAALVGAAETQPEGTFPTLAAMVLVFADTPASSRRDAETAIETAVGMAEAVQEIAARHAISYVKLVSHGLVAATGAVPGGDPTAGARLADAALELRDFCLGTLVRLDLEPTFRIGIDVGPGVGTRLGREPAVFNLWGDAVRMAELMAATAPELGTIQATERAYEALRGRFLFRPRGTFFMPRVGIARSFVLAGRR